MTVAVIMQPTYLPWLGYLDLMDKADLFVVLDNVQFEKQSWQQRNRIKTAAGQWQWLSVPVVRRFPQNIDTVVIDNHQNWPQKHWRSIEQSYRRAPYWAEYQTSLSEIYSRPWENLIALNLELITYLKRQTGIQTQLILASAIPVSGSKVDRLLNICRYLEADIYLSPAGAADYIEEDNRFGAAGLELRYQQFEHPVYAQLYGEFISHLAAIDLLFNQGPNCLEIIRSGSRLAEVF